ncbi:MAG TPA: transmembrane prediction [Verrucomicrobiales bacterium]|nr:transmembrane prediction [Verrucomicrobiales bacterium]
MKRPLSALALGLLVLGVLAQDSGTPTNFGIKDDYFPQDPREYGRGYFADFPTWPVSRETPDDHFVFARLRYNSESWGRRRGGGGRWTTDYPDADLNFSYRLQQLTSLQVSPKGAIVDIVPEQLRHYPFIYMIEPGGISLTEDEARILREYLLNGGFMMVDDFWGEQEWDTFYFALKQIFPDREPEELPLEHEIFRMVFPLKVKPQIPSVGHAMAGRSQGITFERWDAQTPHYKAVYDDKKRMVMIICHNTDLGDGWEEEGTDPWYFREFSEKYAYPLGINIIFYALTH